MKTSLRQEFQVVVAAKKIQAIAQTILTLLIALVLALRPMYVAPDDQSYIDYFKFTDSAHLDSFTTENYLIALIDEPLWLMYVNVLGAILDPELATRFTIFFSVCLFFFATSKLAPRAYFFIFAAFLVCSELAVQLYFNQIRQGMALSLLLFALALTKSPGIRFCAVLLTSFVHTSTLTIAPIVYFTQSQTRPFVRIAFGFLAAIGLLFATYIVFQYLDFGRRTGMYEAVGKANFNFYVAAIAKYLPVFTLFGLSRINGWKEHWYQTALTYFILALSLTIFNEAAGRLMYFATVFVIILIGVNFQSKQGKFLAFYWLSFSVFCNVYDINKYPSYDTWSGRWSMILGF